MLSALCGSDRLDPAVRTCGGAAVPASSWAADLQLELIVSLCPQSDWWAADPQRPNMKIGLSLATAAFLAALLSSIDAQGKWNHLVSACIHIYYITLSLHLFPLFFHLLPPLVDCIMISLLLYVETFVLISWIKLLLCHVYGIWLCDFWTVWLFDDCHDFIPHL